MVGGSRCEDGADTRHMCMYVIGKWLLGAVHSSTASENTAEACHYWTAVSRTESLLHLLAGHPPCSVRQRSRRRPSSDSSQLAWWWYAASLRVESVRWDVSNTSQACATPRHVPSARARWKVVSVQFDKFPSLLLVSNVQTLFLLLQLSYSDQTTPRRAISL